MISRKVILNLINSKKVLYYIFISSLSFKYYLSNSIL